MNGNYTLLLEFLVSISVVPACRACGKKWLKGTNSSHSYHCVLNECHSPQTCQMHPRRYMTRTVLVRRATLKLL